jgi:hypothetical protein
MTHLEEKSPAPAVEGAPHPQKSSAFATMVTAGGMAWVCVLVVVIAFTGIGTLPALLLGRWIWPIVEHFLAPQGRFVGIWKVLGGMALWTLVAFGMVVLFFVGLFFFR